jgi:hypothetical protein
MSIVLDLGFIPLRHGSCYGDGLAETELGLFLCPPRSCRAGDEIRDPSRSDRKPETELHAPRPADHWQESGALEEPVPADIRRGIAHERSARVPIQQWCSYIRLANQLAQFTRRIAAVVR